MDEKKFKDAVSAVDFEDLGCGYNLNISDSEFELDPDIVGQCEVAASQGLPNGEESDALSQELQNSSSQTDMINSEEIDGNPEATNKLRLSIGVGFSDDAWVKEKDKYYEGLSSKQRKFRTDYPKELRLRKFCNPKLAAKRKTVDNFLTQPVARFIPTSSHENLKKPEPKKSMKSSLNPEVGSTSKENLLTELQKCAQHYASRDLPPIVTVNDEVVIDYLDNNSIQMMFEFFLTMAIINTPDEPFEYISDLANQLIKARRDEDAFKNIPRIISTVHVQSLFRIYDRVGAGKISYAQYQNAMDTMSVIRYNGAPTGYDTNEITYETFELEANKALDNVIKSYMFKKTELGLQNDPC